MYKLPWLSKFLLNFKNTQWNAYNKSLDFSCRELFYNLMESVREGKCCNYWLPGINLFKELNESKDNKEQILEILKKLKGETEQERLNVLIDPWLECERCMYMNCCFVQCTPTLMCCCHDDAEDESSSSKALKPMIPASWKYSETTCKCDCLDWKKEFHVYWGDV